LKTITATDLRNLLNAGGVKHVDLSDNEYVLFSPSDIKRLNRVLFIISLLPYKKEARDCDDFSDFAHAVARFWFGNCAFGRIWAEGLGTTQGYHAANFYVTESLEIVLYEPQNRKTYEFAPQGAAIKAFA
jgi:hypothetical protein